MVDRLDVVERRKLRRKGEGRRNGALYALLRCHPLGEKWMFGYRRPRSIEEDGDVDLRSIHPTGVQEHCVDVEFCGSNRLNGQTFNVQVQRYITFNVQRSTCSSWERECKNLKVLWVQRDHMIIIVIYIIATSTPNFKLTSPICLQGSWEEGEGSSTCDDVCIPHRKFGIDQ